ncbi:MAG: cyanophycin synthetase [Planctomycetes bacterium]|nr:cyanophycin synthetase [Planctomycetota bacterium]
MKIVETSVYVGPNLYATFPVIRLTLDLGPLEQWPTARLGAPFIDALLAALPGLAKHGCSFETEGGFVRRLREGEGTWLGHVLEHVAIELQNITGEDVTYGKTRSADAPGQYHVVYEYEAEEVGLEAGKLALTLLHSLLPADLRPAGAVPGDWKWEEKRDEFIRVAQRLALGPSTHSLVKAAEARDIPWLRLNRYSLIQFGHGKWQKRIQATITSETRHIAVEIASDKEETVRILGDLGLPVPKQQLVYSEREAVRQAERIGWPVVVKPLDANHGRGVSIRLTTPEQVSVAFAAAREHSRGVIVESFLEGFDHRLLVVNGELVAAALRKPGHVVGDGVHTIEQLVEIVNRDPRRGVGHEKVLTKLEIDAQAQRLLEKKGYVRTTVPAKGEEVFLRSTGNLSTGGTSIDVTDTIHPDNREMAARAIKAIGLDIGGVDFLTPDITRSYREVGGGICEVNAAPGFRMHVAPTEGKARNVAEPVMEMLFPPGTPTRIPIAAVTGTNGKTTTARMIAHVFKMNGWHPGLATTDGVYSNGHLTIAGDMTGPTAARMVLRDPSVDVAVLETARGGLLRRGMGYKRCNVAAVTNIAADHLGLKGVNSLEELARVKRIIVEVARDYAVLNADDEHCLRMADHTRAKICYVTMDPGHELVKEHIRAGGRAVVLEEGINGQMITLYDKGAHMPLLWTHLIPATLDGRALHNVQNAMFAAAVTYSMGIKLEEIRHALQTFDTTFFQAPGRMNVCNEHPFKVILDYGHNPAAIRQMVELIERLKPKGRKLLVVAAPGDRRDEDVREIAAICAGHFDHYVCRRDDNPRGRKPDEIPQMLAATLREKGVPAEKITVIIDEPEALDCALKLARKDDLVLAFGDQITRCWNQITRFRPEFGEVRSRPDGAIPQPVKMELRQQHREELRPGFERLIRDERGVRLAREVNED